MDLLRVGGASPGVCGLCRHGGWSEVYESSCVSRINVGEI
jgi:hypothetical protein